MAEAEGISMEDFRVLVERAGLGLTDEELASLKPMYDHFAAQTATLDEVDLGAEDLAVVFQPQG